MRCKVLTLVVILGFVSVSGNRVKRHLVFNKGSKFFFSLDVRDNLFEYFDFFAHVIGFKIDWELPESSIHKKTKRIHRRDLHEGIKYFFNQHKINGTLCAEKFTCEALVLLPQRNSFLAQFYEYIFAPSEEEATYKTVNRCKEVLQIKTLEKCPFSINSIAYESHANFRLMSN